MGFPNTDHSLAVATVGTKGQIVIPQDVREQLGIQAGDKVVLIMRGEHNGAFMMPVSNLRTWLDSMTANFDELQAIASEQEDLKKKGAN